MRTSSDNYWATIAHSISVYLPKIALALVVLLAAWVLIRLLLAVIRRSLRLAKMEATAISLIIAAVRVVAWALAAAAVLSLLGLNQVSLGLAVGTALTAAVLATGVSGSVADILEGVFLVADPGFTVGRRVTAAGVEGIVREITLRKTILEDAEGNIHVIPNRSVDSATYILRPIETNEGRTTE